EKDVLPVCRKLGIGYMAYAPLGRGFLTAAIKTPDALLPKDQRREHPRFSQENINKNNGLIKSIEDIAAARECTAAQVALAWLLARGDDIVPIPGTKRRNYLEQNCKAVNVELTTDDLAQLDKTFAPGVAAGTRYPDKQMRALGI
ncbi:MAG: aldo/keto reductase, partial [Burkholderiales bacterium]|nr:aldo/keto reductase [Burkholderiales bacterium]